MSRLSIIMPAYNEAELITSSINTLADYLSNNMSDTSLEVLIIINSPASDGTLAAAQKAVDGLSLAKSHNFIVHDAKKRLGKGGAVKLGMQMAEGDYKLFMDTDLSTPVHHIQQAFNLVKKPDVDIAIGVRNINQAHSTFLRRLSSRASNLVVRMLILPGFKDTQCGFKIFTSQAAETVFSRVTSTGWSFDMEALVIARAHRLSIAQMAIKDWQDPKEDGLTGDNTIAVMLKELKELARFTCNKLTKRYK